MINFTDGLHIEVFCTDKAYMLRWRNELQVGGGYRLRTSVILTQDDVVPDIGAHVGITSIIALSVGVGVVIAAEPCFAVSSYYAETSVKASQINAQNFLAENWPATVII